MDSVPAHRSYVGPADRYDLVAAMQFNLLTALGLREHHYLLDIGCGSLRAARLLIPYLLRGRYFGIEPERWAVEEGIALELGSDLVSIKQPTFHFASDFSLGAFGRSFDFLLAQSIFSHTPMTMLRNCLSAARQVMGSRSIFACTYMPGPNDYAGNEWVYPECCEYTKAFMEGVVEEAGLAATFLDWPHPNGQTWLAITLPDSKRIVPEVWRGGLLRANQELAACRQELARLRQHPYIRVGVWAKQLLTGSRT